MQINNKTIAVVTGGASGLGAASARALAKAGAQVTIFDMDAAQGEAAAAEVSGQFQRVVTFHLVEVEPNCHKQTRRVDRLVARKAADRPWPRTSSNRTRQQREETKSLQILFLEIVILIVLGSALFNCFD